ncbi:MAG: preprotein translocase subunit SecG [Bacteroidota bacterium]|nr:preprotein translocase subunit SecG [Bacteroidota bacterium]
MGAYIVISVLILITCGLLSLVILVQNSKGGGLSSTFAGQNQYMGVRKTGDFLEKATWTLAVVVILLSLSTIFVIPRSNSVEQQNSELQDMVKQTNNAVDYQAAPQKTDDSE